MSSGCFKPCLAVSVLPTSGALDADQAGWHGASRGTGRPDRLTDRGSTPRPRRRDPQPFSAQAPTQPSVNRWIQGHATRDAKASSSARIFAMSPLADVSVSAI